MEALEGHEMTVALVMGGALLAAALKFLTGSVGSQGMPKQSQSKSKNKKNKKAKKNKKSEAKPVEVEVTEKKSNTKTKTKTKTTVKVEEKVKAQPKPKEEVKEVTKKKKKPKSKKKQVQIVEEDSDDSSSDEDKVQPVAAAEETKDQPLRAADLFDPSAVVEDGWESVPVRQRKNKLSVNNNDTVPLKSTAAGGKKKKERREVVKIGDHAAVVLGEGGATISNIQNVSGARVNVNKENQTCTITGDDEAVLVAQKLVTALMENQSKFVETVTSRLDKSILSKNETKTLIRELSGAKLDYNFGDNRNDPLVITVSGEKEKVEHARQLIKDYLSGKNPEGTFRRIKVTAFQGRILIGQKGAQINLLQSQSGATINVDFNDNNNSSELAEVTVIGSETQIQHCLNDIQGFLMEHNVKTAVELPSDARAVLLKLNDLRKSIFNLEISVADDRSRIVLCGSESGVSEGRSLLKKWIEDELGPPQVKPNESMEAIELGASVGKVVGKGRAKINDIQSKCKVRLMEVKQGSVLYIVGESEGVKKAASMVKDIVTKHQQKLAQSEKEQQRLQSAAWEVIPDSKNSFGNLNNAVAAQNDYGGFQLAQAQGW